MTGTRRLLRALACLFGLGALVGGLPALLIVVVGWPLPHGLPSADQVRSALGDGWRPDERFVLGVLAVLVWLSWAQIMRHVFSQVRLQLRLQRAGPAAQPAAPVSSAASSRRGPMQRVVSWLVGGLMMASPLLPAAASASPPVPVVMTLTRAVADPLVGAADRSGLTPAPAPSAPTYVVRTWAERRDCLWNIAERYLGDPFRWTEIRDLNADRVQHDGRTLGAEPSSWVYPGWELVLPADATGADVIPAGAAVGAPASPTPPGAGTSAVATAPGSVSPPTTATVASPSASTKAAAPVAPSTTATAVTTSPSTATTRAMGPGVAPPASGRPGPAAPGITVGANGAAAGHRRPVVSVNPWATRAAMAGALGLPVFALGGWLVRLRRGRVAQASRARPGRDVVRATGPEVETLERQARSIAADQAEEWIDAAMRALTAALAESTLAAAPEVRCVRAGELGVEVLLAEPFPVAPLGWAAADGGHVWHPAPDIDLDELRALGAEHPALAPALVSLGATPEGPILVDLEGLGALAVEGDAERVSAFLAGAALELDTASWAQGVELRVYGLAGFERLPVAVTDGAELVREARSQAQLVGDSLGEHGSPLAARLGGPGAEEPWYPMVVVTGPDAEAAVVDELAELAVLRSGVAVVAVGPLAGAEWQLVVSPEGAAVLKPLGLDVRVTGVDLSATALRERAVFDPIAAAGAADPVDPSGASEGHGDTPAEAADGVPATAPLAAVKQRLDRAAIGTAFVAAAAADELDDIAPASVPASSRARRARPQRRQDCEVWVSVLRRTPEVTGWVTEARGRRKLAEVLIYLAVYGTERPIPSAELRTNCWPPLLVAGGPGERERLREISAQTFHQAMSRLRKQLGEGSVGWHLPLAPDGSYVIGPGVGCDWTLFRALVAGAEAVAGHDAPRAIAQYREALALIEGEPFADVPPGSCAWADSKHLVTDIRLAVSKAAGDLAQLAMDSEPETAVWATQQGLLLLPTQLELFDTWMRAATELGDAGALDRSVAAKCWALEQLDPEGGVPPDTMELYRHLKARLAARQPAGPASVGRR